MCSLRELGIRLSPSRSGRVWWGVVSYFRAAEEQRNALRRLLWGTVSTEIWASKGVYEAPTLWQQKCSRTPSRAGSCRSFTRSAASLSSFGKKRCAMATSRESRITTSNRSYSRLRVQMFLQPTSPAQQVLFLDFNFSLTLLDPKKTLGIKLPFLVMIIKNLKKYFTFEVQVFCAKSARKLLIYRCSMIKTFDDDSEHQTINRQRV